MLNDSEQEQRPYVLSSKAGELQFFALRAADLAAGWGYLIEPHLRRLERRGECAQAIVHETQRGHAQLWAVSDGNCVRAIVVTQTCMRDHERFCRVWVAVGHLASKEQLRCIVPQALAALEQWARSVDCESIEIPARRGVVSILRGYCLADGVYRKTLAELH